MTKNNTDRLDVTYSGTLNVRENILDKKQLDVMFTIEGKSGLPTTTSILINPDPKNYCMITFDYQELKKIIEEGNINE